MKLKANALANALWATVAKTKQTKGKFSVNQFVHSYRKVANCVYRIDETMTMYFLSEPMNY